ncbi:hypothetical protein C4577_01620 [Candidatus Parcubacteria bacterium]|nr:MAG: hypothetical protein C4577_01620 [Candidatus Parcubacteria bacterium]
MDLYLAGLASTERMMDFVLDFNSKLPEEKQIGVMCTFAQKKGVDKVIKKGFKKIFVDSGAFTVFNSGGIVDIDELASFIKEREEYISYYISLDVIADKEGFQSLKNWYYLKEKGLNPIPVFHAGEEQEVMQQYAEHCNYICLGGMAGVSQNWKSWIPFLTKTFQKYPNHQFHAMGVNDPKLAQRFPWKSCDALSWRSGSRFGQIITPWGRWWISERNAKSISPYDAEAIGFPDWMREHGIPYPLPEGYDFNLLDQKNIEVLHELIVEYHATKFEYANVFPLSLF